ncbi:MAG: asparaginase [Oscillospiraceae bacterium]|nr:asparaginase [Oscillospiraceae bacterium]
MRIALILTGGTICSRAGSDGARRSDAGTAVTALEEHYRRQNPYSSVTFTVMKPLDKLSEDLTPEDWLLLLQSIAKIQDDLPDGIIIAHGTDTLEQTAAMLSAALFGLPVPVILVSAIAPLDDPQTNGHANFSAAVRLICKHLEPGVWAVYENSGGDMLLHRGFELEACRHDSLDFFSSGMQPVSAVGQTAERILKKEARIDLRAVLSHIEKAPEVLRLESYTGLRYDRISLSGLSAVVHGTYHSETANSSLYSPYGMHALLSECREAKIPCYLAPCRMSGQTYGSAYDLVQAGAIPLEGMPLHTAYGLIWAACLYGCTGDDITVRVRQMYQSLQSQSFRCCI